MKTEILRINNIWSIKPTNALATLTHFLQSNYKKCSGPIFSKNLDHWRTTPQNSDQPTRCAPSGSIAVEKMGVEDKNGHVREAV